MSFDSSRGLAGTVLITGVVGLALLVATSALAAPSRVTALDHLSLTTHVVAVPSSAKPKK